MTALLAVLAIAGYQHRDKLAELLGTAGGKRGDLPPEERGRAGGQAAAAGGPAGAGTAGGIGGLLGGGLRELVDSFRQAGEAETADSWVRHGPNRELSPDRLERAVGPETLDLLSRQTGMPRHEILARLTRDLPDAVDRYTPEGRLPQG
ncbi:YidB family protein [Falsiroseomonas sp.]|uniref:YidB family protein n=1 Tax=Falsiroseomonas sp. TaxID=2870721 RepID=UPI003562466A